MTEVTVIEAGCSEGNDIAGKIASGIVEYGESGGDILIRCINSMDEIPTKKTDLLVLTTDAIKSSNKVSAPISCDILLMPGDIVCDIDADVFDAECIVTYGMSPKNTITLSSISEASCVLALQRELVTTRGDVLDRQEFKIKGGLRPDCLLAVTGALLILGQKISDVNQ